MRWSSSSLSGAIVRYVPLPGKGNVLRRMFGEVDASVYLLVDGDDTYDASVAPELVGRLYHHHLDMVVGHRVEAENAHHAYRRGHRFERTSLERHPTPNTQRAAWVSNRLRICALAPGAARLAAQVCPDDGRKALHDSVVIRLIVVEKQRDKETGIQRGHRSGC